ncbi:MAG: hypothetical protein HZC42_09275 [Candidatus Eisenbacteria bacterium]|nr:hypothetical protein [Candidatus Eisenbacteria bacterium]
MRAPGRFVRRVLRGPGCLALAAALLAGCASAPPRARGVRAVTGLPVRVALLPLENLTGNADAGNLMTRILFVELVRTHACEVVEAGIVDTAVVELRIRNGGSLSAAELRGLGSMLDVRYVLAGTVLESGSARTPDGDVPTLGVALKLLDVGSGRVVWAQMRFRTGDDRETVFGWGREKDPQRLAAALAADVLKDFSIPGAGAPHDSTGGRE